MDGRQLDALVAQARGFKRDVRVKGSDKFVTIYSNNKWFADGQQTEEDLLHYGAPLDVSTDIDEAMGLVEELRRGGNGKAACCIRLEITDYPVEKDCKCTIYGPDQAEVSADGRELPEAICLAYLKAKGVEVPHA